MRKTFSLAPLLLLLMTTPAHANLWGKYLQACPINVSIQQDPLASPGVEVSDHMHDSGGSTVFGKNMTTGAMMNAPTSCFLHSNHSAYWWPAMVGSDGTVYHAKFAQGYYAAAGADPAQIAGGKVQPFPTGFRMLVGDPNSTVLQSTSLVRWHCNSVNPPQSSSPPTSCPPGAGPVVDFNTAPCWDGLNLDTPNHHDHVANTTNAGAGCPTSHPFRIPQLQWSFVFGPEAVGSCPTSDHGIPPCGHSAHMDLWEAQDPAVQDQLTRCMNDPGRNTATAKLCGIFTYDGNAGMPPNAWFPTLLAWSNTIGYVNSTGFAGAMPPVTP